MADFEVTAKYNGNKIKFRVLDVVDGKEALEEAIKEAKRIFGYQGNGAPPTVDVEPLYDKDDTE